MENTDWLNSQDNYLIYFGDTMCSWCYGFAEELSDLANANPEVPLKVVNGGLRPHGTTKNGDVVPEFGNQVMSEFLRHHWEEVNKRSGQPFSYAILDDESFIYDTEPAARACIVAREMNPELEFEFFKEVQKAFYARGMNTNELATFITIASKLGFDVDEFQMKFNSDEMKRATVQDFQLSANLGIKGFPSLVLKKGTEFFLIANGYNEAKNIQPVIDKIFSEN